LKSLRSAVLLRFGFFGVVSDRGCASMGTSLVRSWGLGIATVCTGSAEAQAKPYRVPVAALLPILLGRAAVAVRATLTPLLRQSWRTIEPIAPCVPHLLSEATCSTTGAATLSQWNPQSYMPVPSQGGQSITSSSQASVMFASRAPGG
jgi:hypothetical protein